MNFFGIFCSVFFIILKSEIWYWLELSCQKKLLQNRANASIECNGVMLTDAGVSFALHLC